MDELPEKVKEAIDEFGDEHGIIELNVKGEYKRWKRLYEDEDEAFDDKSIELKIKLFKLKIMALEEIQD